MDDLKSQSCVPVRGDTQALTGEQIDHYMQHVPYWSVIEVDDIKRLRRIFKFEDFAQALDFTNRVGEIAEAEDHHPALLTEWGKVTVNWWTHSIKGLHKNDFIMAARVDAL